MIAATNAHDGFRLRLRQLLEQDGRSQSAFASDAGIDRSTLSQLMSNRNRRLPRVETLVAISQATGTSIDWLLGLSSEGPIRADILREALALSRTERSPLDEALIGWFRESVGSKVRYVPATLPDLLKTEAVMRHEVARHETTRPEQKMGVAEAPLAVAHAPGSDIECCNSIQALEDFAHGADIWRTLDRDLRIAQLDHMITLCDELYPSFRWFLYDARQRYAGAVTIFGLDRAVIYLGQIYIVLNSEAHVREFVDQFDGLIRAATVQPPDVPLLLARLRAEVASGAP
jgi:transcriptional regulator with XRE-family HTH domain